MSGKTRQYAVALVLVVASAMTLACTSPVEKSRIAEIAAPLEQVPSDATGRFILTVAVDDKEQVSPRDIASVVSVLEKRGAEKIEPIGSTRILIVTTDAASVYAAIETGLVTSVQVDRVSKTQKK